MAGDNGRLSLSYLEIVKVLMERPDVRDVGRDALIRLLEEHGYNMTRTALTIGLGECKATLYSKLRQYGIDVVEERRKYLERSKTTSTTQH